MTTLTGQTPTLHSFLMKVIYGLVGIFLLTYSSSSSGPGGMAMAQTQTQLEPNHTGTMFNFIPGLGACGYTNTSTQVVASVSSAVFSTFPGATANPNKNPICHSKVLIRSPTSRTTTLTASIVDFFTSGSPGSVAKVNDIGLSDAGFVVFAPLGDGVLGNVTWVFV